MNAHENEHATRSSAQYLDYILVAIAMAILLWLTSRLPLASRMIIIASILPGPIIGALAMHLAGKNAVSPAQKRSLLTSLCFLSAGVGCTIAGINRYPEHMAFISATGIALLGLYVVWMIRLMQRPDAGAAAS